MSGMRFRLKKAARATFGLAGPLLVDAQQAKQLRVLTYHRFGSIPGDVFCIPPEVFESQVRFIADSGLGVSLDQVLQGERQERNLCSHLLSR